MAVRALVCGAVSYQELTEDSCAPRGFREFLYVCHHLATTTVHRYRVACWSRQDFLELLATWNRLGEGVWQYVER